MKSMLIAMMMMIDVDIVDHNYDDHDDDDDDVDDNDANERIEWMVKKIKCV